MKQIKLITIFLFLFVLGACSSSNQDKEPIITPLTLEIKSPLGMDGNLSQLQGTISDISGKSQTLEFDQNGVAKCNLVEGNYTIEVSAVFRFTDEHQITRDEVLKIKDNIELVGPEMVQKVLHFSSFKVEGTFLIEEIFFAGSTTEAGTQYDDDKYIKIVNNSTQTLYADGLALLVSHFSSDEKKHNLQPNVIAEKFPAKIVYQIKGSGTDYPVKPGESIILCQSAIDHTKYNKNSMSLLNANFEWLSETAAIDGEFPNNPEVPNMTLVYSNDGNGVWSMNNNGYDTYAIAQLSAEFVANLTKYNYEYTEDIIFEGVNYGTVPGTPALALPNEMLLDAVNLSTTTDMQWLPISPVMDSGYAVIAEAVNDPLRYGKSVLRKSQIKDGVTTFIDTNNSSADFEVSTPASLIK